jgi:hypothetical protein
MTMHDGCWCWCTSSSPPSSTSVGSRSLTSSKMTLLVVAPSALSMLLLLVTIASVQPFQLAPPRLTSAARTTTLRHPGRTTCLVPSLQSSTRRDDGDDSATEESAYDITSNLFPEDRRSRMESSFANCERSEMNDRPPPSSSPTAASASSAPASTTTNTAKRKIGSTEDRHASALYQKIISQRKQSSRQTKSTNAAGAAYYDITQSSFPENDQQRRKSSSFAPEQLSEMDVRNPRWSKTPPRSDREETRLDITSVFPNDRPSRLVNTGTKKEWTTSGSYSDSKKQQSDEGGNKNSASPPSTGRNNVEDDGASFDITQQHFGSDRASFSLHVNSGMMERRGTHSGQVTPRSYIESYRNIAHNFSSNRASLMGHPPPRKVGTGGEGDGEVYLDKHQFSSSVSPASVSTSVTTTPSKSTSKTATNAMWRKGDPITSPSFSSTKKNEEICLDTPRAFVKNLDMIASTKRSVTEADKYLDTNSFSWNIDSTKRKLPIGTSQRQQPYLDKPRPFQSNVDMVSSNFSGAKFKRSSDIPPELKNIKDYYDITTAPMPMVEDMAGRGGDRGSRLDNDDPVDVTRTRFSTLERTSSVIRDGNMRASRAWINDSVSSDERTNGSSRNEAASIQYEEEEYDDDEPGQSSPFDDVMHWLLTHLPNLQEKDAISYFNHLLEDGFDTVDILKELLEEDLYFMKKGHRRAMLRSISSISDVSREGEEDVGGVTTAEGEDEDESIVDEMSRIRDISESMTMNSDTTEGPSVKLEAGEKEVAVDTPKRSSDPVAKEEESVEKKIDDI